MLIIFFHNQIAFIFTSSKVILEAINRLSILLAFTILLNSVQPILSGVAIGSGWQAYAANINLSCYTIFLGLFFHFRVMVWDLQMFLCILLGKLF
ncbi:unnamed protein product [Coffea canephora]|uniref:Protein DETOXIFICATION n=1 Tax=Coffea canephora TaxID=49390 RepID=A0A068U1P5_COFCA|nr:unnamed protein product [Coffea canephora]